MGRTDRATFVKAYGEPPYQCFFCHSPCEFEHIHHIDGDRKNEHPYNLVAAHAHCHHRHHTLLRRAAGWGWRGGSGKGWKHSEEGRANISVGLKGNTHTRGKKLKPLTAEHKAKIAAAMKGNKNRSKSGG